MSGYEPDKYEVFSDDDKIDSTDFFVLKKGDTLATATLWNYLNNINTLLDLDRERRNSGHGPVLDAMERDHLEALRDDVHEMAVEWGLTKTKLPD